MLSKITIFLLDTIYILQFIISKSKRYSWKKQEKERRELNICCKFKCRSSALAPSVILHEGHHYPNRPMEEKT